MVKTIYGYYHLNISSENDQEYKNVFEHESREIVGDKPITFYHLGELLYRIDHYDRSEKYFNSHLKQCDPYLDQEVSEICYAGLSKVSM